MRGNAVEKEGRGIHGQLAPSRMAVMNAGNNGGRSAAERFEEAGLGVWPDVLSAA